jgi:hypothetical protein
MLDQPFLSAALDMGLSGRGANGNASATGAETRNHNPMEAEAIGPD